MKPKIQTNADLFARRGNPWNGKRREIPAAPVEITEYDRDIDRIRRRHDKTPLLYLSEKAEGYKSTENPEIDQYFCPKAAPHNESRPEVGYTVDRGYADKVAQIHLKYLKRKNGRNTPDIPEAFEPIGDTRPKPCKTKAAFSVYVKYSDGSEEEFDRNGEKAARRSFDRYVARKDTTEVELWSYDTGELLLRYEEKPK